MNSTTLDRIEAEVALIRLMANLSKNGHNPNHIDSLKQLRLSTACIVAALDQLEMEMRQHCAVPEEG